MIPWWLALLLVLIAAPAGAIAAYFWLRHKQKKTRRPRHRLEQLAGGEDVFPPTIGNFRAIVRALAESKAASLRPRYGPKLRFTAQDGEDILLAQFFGYKSNGYFVEIGAYDGLYLSNSYFFEQIGWRGLLVEPLPTQSAACKLNRPGSVVIQAALGKRQGQVTLTELVGQEGLETLSYVGSPTRAVEKGQRLANQTRTHQVSLRTFEDVAEEAGLRPGHPIDFISIDCEGMDFEILQSIDLTKWQPHLLIIESIDQTLLNYLAERGYQPMLRIRANTIFSRVAADQAYLSVASYWQALTTFQDER